MEKWFWSAILSEVLNTLLLSSSFLKVTHSLSHCLSLSCRVTTFKNNLSTRSPASGKHHSISTCTQAPNPLAKPEAPLTDVVIQTTRDISEFPHQQTLQCMTIPAALLVFIKDPLNIIQSQFLSCIWSVKVIISTSHLPDGQWCYIVQPEDQCSEFATGIPHQSLPLTKGCCTLRTAVKTIWNRNVTSCWYPWNYQLLWYSNCFANAFGGRKSANTHVWLMHVVNA